MVVGATVVEVVGVCGVVTAGELLVDESFVFVSETVAIVTADAGLATVGPVLNELSRTEFAAS